MRDNADWERVDMLVANMSYSRELMRFHLVYRGLLPSAGNTPKPKWAHHIRKKIHPQLEELWRSHRILNQVRGTAIVMRADSPASLRTREEGPFDVERDVDAYPARPDEVDLSAPMMSGPHQYVPLVRESMHLNCSLAITFLGHDDPGAVVTQGGDLDGRIKCLLDALTMPKAELAARYPPDHEPMHCLMESDSLVSGLDIETGRLLVSGERHQHEVHLMIEVAINVLRVGPWNLPLLGR